MLYYLLNFTIIGLYPITRMFRLFNFYILDVPDEEGHTRENSIFYTIIAFVVVKYFRSYSRIQFLSDIFFSIKLALITSYMFVDPRISMAYGAACLLVWLLCSDPGYSGPSAMHEVESLEEFEDIVGVHFRDDDQGNIIEELHERLKKKRNHQQRGPNQYKSCEMVFAEFYVDWADTCNFTKEIWAEYSLKYQTNRLKFLSINLNKIPRLAECYQISTSSISRQLPTLIIFEDGEEVQRFPPVDKVTRKIPRVLKYGKRELQNYFDLEKRYLATRDL